MSNTDLKKWSKLFWVAAIYNISATLGAFAYHTHLNLMFQLEQLPNHPVTLVYHIGFWSCVFCFGLGYAMLAKHPERYPGIVILGIIGKLIAFVLFSITYFMGVGSAVLLIGGLGDFIFAMAFIAFLKQSQSHRFN